MQIFREIRPLKAFIHEVRESRKAVSLVPTMGNLHAGHLALVHAAQEDGATCICSLYVNPAQFNNAQDLKNYPRTPEQDFMKLEEAGCAAAFCPGDAEMYPHPPGVVIGFGPLSNSMEGEFRKGHFSGVALIVSKLLNIVQPDRVFFGQKDWQQTVIIRRLVDELQFGTEVRVLPTVREPDGLAMSSRNTRLDTKQRGIAPLLFEVLRSSKTMLLNGKEMKEVRRAAEEQFNAKGVRLEYLELADRDSLERHDRWAAPERSVLCIAAFVGAVRLIDNLLL